MTRSVIGLPAGVYAGLYRLVVPSLFVLLLLAEHTTAMRFLARPALGVFSHPFDTRPNACPCIAYPTMSTAMLLANFPTLVPPNFWTIQPPGRSFSRR